MAGFSGGIIPTNDHAFKHQPKAHDLAPAWPVLPRSSINSFTLDLSRNKVYIHINMAGELDLQVMENCVCFNLRWVSRALSHFFVSELNHHGLLPTQTPILGLLAARPEASMAEVSDWLGMDRTTLVRNLRPLERDGLIKATGKGRGHKVSSRSRRKAGSRARQIFCRLAVAQQKVIRTLGPERWTEILRDLERAALGSELTRSPHFNL
jgi:DNA-binding MarR family transcriptional regulator